VPEVNDVRENENNARNASVNGTLGKVDEVVGVGPHQKSNVRMEDLRRPSLTINTSEYHSTMSRPSAIPTAPDSVLENDIEGMNDPRNVAQDC